jgi:hypothetical protein
MACENPACVCEHEAVFFQDGRPFCGDHCVEEDSENGVCACSHDGCPNPDDLAPSAGTGAVEGVTAGVPAASQLDERPAIFRSYTCPACQLEFVVMFKDADLRHHAAVRLACPRPPDERLLDCGGPLCPGLIMARLPPRYRVFPASPDEGESRPGDEDRFWAEVPVNHEERV